METFLAEGLGVALVTPFTSDNQVDYTALERLVSHVTQPGGVDYLVALGTTAETPTLSADERREVLRAIARANTRQLPLVVGMGGNDTAEQCAELRALPADLCSAVLVVAPWYNKPSQEGLYRHFMALAEASPVPIIMYNIPARTGVNILPATQARILTDAPEGKVIAVKEATGSMRQIDDVISVTDAACSGHGFSVLSGDDSLALPVISVGGRGVISVIANAFPLEMQTVVSHALRGDIPEATRMHRRLMPAIRAIFADGNPAGIKTLLSMKGICLPTMRLPLVEPSDPVRNQIADALKDL